MLVLVASALAAPSGFRPVASGDGCQISVGPVERDGAQTLHAECHWADASFSALDAALAEVDAWQRLVWCIADSKLVADAGGASLVWQRHVVSGLAPRENVLEIRATADGDLRRYAWTRSDAPYAFGADAIVVPRNEGFWEIRPSADGGVDLVHQVTYDPAGAVPAWLVRWFQRQGAVDVMSHVHAIARAGA